ncbi:type IV pilus twitching motility protein PilT [Selenomonas sp. F0473]|uniref:type IV pilus twitching motility protein PilT n=1 Tax=Selenomonas sp. F0473 TaxID=999423 RepID=UPI00029E9FB0|nr:PilT/PilU family type 4a pilus ATPase [Selenomonas sp. F0473]EKU70638.1 twitching motility protein [Selenomonas sp. F0473]
MDEQALWEDILRRAMTAEASDLHAAADQRVQMRRDGVLYAEEMVPSAAFMRALAVQMLSEAQRAELAAHRDVDFSWRYEGRRFRGNIYGVRDVPALALRLLPARIRSVEEIGMPAALRTLCTAREGLALVCGATGSGKTTTIAALLQAVNQTRAAHIVTLEDPIEYIFEPARAFVSQRALGRDFISFPAAVRSALREDPDIVLIGEIRDRETMEAALSAASTGVLVLGTLHTRSAEQTAMRVESMFPADVRDAVRAQFADVVTGIFAQRLVPGKDGGRVAVIEALCATPAVRNMIRQGHYGQLGSVMMSGAAQGMQTSAMAEAALRAAGLIL